MTAPSRPPTRRAGSDARPAGVVLVGVAVLVCLVASLAQPARHGVLDGAALVGLAARVIAVTAAAGVLGHLLLCLCRPRSSGSAADVALMAGAAGWARVWVVALGAGAVVEVLSPGSIAARAAVGPDDGDAVVRLRWLVLGIALAALVRVFCSAARTRADVGVVLGIAVGCVAVATSTGHGGSLLAPTTGSIALLAHVLSATAWTGGLLALVVHVRSTRAGASTAPTASAYSRLALVCYIVLAGSGLLGLASRTSTGELLDSGGYLALVVVKAALLLVLGVLGAAQRRTTLGRLAAGDSRSFLSLSVAELTLMAAAAGLGVALAHTAT